MSERFGKRKFTDLPIRPVGIPIVRDVSMLPMFLERLDVNMMRAGFQQLMTAIQDCEKPVIGAVVLVHGSGPLTRAW